MGYDHIQRAPLWLLLAAVGVLMLIAATSPSRAASAASLVLIAAGALMLLAAACFQRLRVRDEEDALAVRYGPLPVFSKRIAYARVRRATRAVVLDRRLERALGSRPRLDVQLWGFDCALIEMEGGRLIRIGSDDTDALVALLHSRIRTIEEPHS